MTTVVNPTSTPTAVFNRSGTAVLSLAGSGNSQTSAASAVIPSICGHLVLLVDTTGSDFAVMLPSSPDVGDVVEVYAVGTHAANVFPQSGGQISQIGANNQAIVDPTVNGVWFRYLGNNSWGSIGNVAN